MLLSTEALFAELTTGVTTGGFKSIHAGEPDIHRNDIGRELFEYAISASGAVAPAHRASHSDVCTLRKDAVSWD
jgi:hypothetical protein